MNQILVSDSNIFPITKAREQLGNLVDKATKNKYFVLTKGGSPKAAIVDFDYFVDLQNVVNNIYKKTFIDPKLLPYTREFSDKEINEWLEADKI